MHHFSFPAVVLGKRLVAFADLATLLTVMNVQE